MWNLILDSLIDTLKMLPFLFLAFWLIEFIEHKMSDKLNVAVAKSGRIGPLVGGILGAIPQCGFSVMASNLYVTRIISLGTLIAIYLSTSDEMVPIMLSSNIALKTVLIIVLVKVIIGIIVGFIIDLALPKKKEENYHLCDDENCDCEHGILKSCLIHTFKNFIFILLFNLIINFIFYFLPDFSLTSNNILGILVSPLVGLIPNCASSVLLSESFLTGIISFPVLISGLLASSGVGILVLFRANKDVKENLFIVFLLYIISIIVGIILSLLKINLV